MIVFQLPMAPIYDPISINIHLLMGDPPTLVDTGLRTDSAWNSLNAQLKEQHLDIIDIKQVVLTHAHADHYGLAARIARKTGAQILGHPDAVPRFYFEKKHLLLGNQFLFDTLLHSGVPEGSLSKRLQPEKIEDPLTDPVVVTKTITEGYQVTDGKEVWEVIELPGHAPGIIGLYNPESREILTSDALLSKTNSRPSLYMPSAGNNGRYPYMGDYMTTLERLSKMDLSLAWPAHGKVIDNPQEVAMSWIHENLKKVKMFSETLKDGEKTAYQIWKAVFPRVLPFDPVKGLVEVITYLDLPVLEGQVGIYDQDGVVYYHLC